MLLICKSKQKYKAPHTKSSYITVCSALLRTVSIINERAKKKGPERSEDDI